LSEELRREFGDIDIYLFDQLHRGILTPGMRVLDAGCGRGRNLVYLLRTGFDVRAIDAEPAAVDAARALAPSLVPGIDGDRFRVEPVEALSLPAASIDYVISSAVLHFARDETHWYAMVDAMWRVLAPGGVLFARLATTVGQEGRLTHLDGRRYVLPDGSERFLVDEPMLSAWVTSVGGRWIDPLKTSVVHGLRSMATWVVGK
jgi:SAM-dependent methyltransferase